MATIDDDNAEADAERESAKLDPAALARTWIQTAQTAVLSTLSVDGELDGFPYGSIVPYAVSTTGAPIILIARIAAHTKNLVRDSRASLFIHESKDGDPQSGWRLSIMGRFTRLARASDDAPPENVRLVDDGAFRDVEQRYQARVPNAPLYRETHGFDFWILDDIMKARFIAGFGKIAWIPGRDLLTTT